MFMGEVESGLSPRGVGVRVNCLCPCGRKQAGSQEKATTGTKLCGCIQRKLKPIAEDPREVASGRVDDITKCYGICANIIDNVTPRDLVQ